jgi:hypothetical protein
MDPQSFFVLIDAGRVGSGRFVVEAALRDPALVAPGFRASVSKHVVTARGERSSGNEGASSDADAPFQSISACQRCNTACTEPGAMARVGRHDHILRQVLVELADIGASRSTLR